jgi:signal transduction histidine kinase
MNKKKLSKSLATATMSSMAVRITVVVIISTLIAYFHMNGVLLKQHLNNLSSYTKVRGSREEKLFKLAATNHSTMGARLVNDLKAPYPGNVEKDFEKFFMQRKDGSWHDRDPKLNTYDEPSFYHGVHVPLTLKSKQILLNAKAFIKQYGRAYEKNFTNTYVNFPDNSDLIFWPGVNWGGELAVGFDLRKEEYVYIADPEHNPERLTKWTGIYYDAPSKIWMLSIETPVYDKDEFFAVLGHDIAMSDILDRAVKEKMVGTNNIIIRDDARLVAHADYMKSIETANGNLVVTDSKSNIPKLKNMFETVLKNKFVPEFNNIVEDVSGESYLGIYLIEGPNWYFLVEYPKSLITSQAIKAAEVIMMLGIFSLLSEILILYYIIRKKIAIPLGQLVDVTRYVAEGDFSQRSTLVRDDELGLLSDTFNKMLESIEEKNLKLHNYTHDLETQVKERTNAIEHQRAQMVNNSKLVSLGIMAGGIAHEINNPLTIIHGTATKLVHHVKKNDLSNEIVLESANTISKTSDRIAGIIRGLKAFARDGKQDPMLVTELRQILEDTRFICAERLKHHEIDFQVIGVNENTKISCRAVQITQVLVNLISNSIDAISLLPEKWIKLIIEENETIITIRLRDSGKGIPIEISEKLMTPFFTTKEIGKGTGLGLSISFGIIKEHEGLFYYNKNGTNTEFVIEFKKPS